MFAIVFITENDSRREVEVEYEITTTIQITSARDVNWNEDLTLTPEQMREAELQIIDDIADHADSLV